MGICFSCLRPIDEPEEEVNERTSLLHSAKEDETNDEDRQRELDSVVNQLSETLIDVTTFLVPSEQMQPNLPKYQSKDDESDDESEDDIDYIPQPAHIRITQKQKIGIKKVMDQISDEIKENCYIHDCGPLIVHFD